MLKTIRNIIVLSILFALTTTVLGAQPVDLSLNLEKGKMYNFVTEQHIKSTIQTDQGTRMTEQDITINSTWVVKNVNPESFWIDMNFERVRVKILGAGRALDFDSADVNDVNELSEIDLMARPYAAMIGTGFGVKISKTGKVLDVKGFKQFEESILRKLPAMLASAMKENDQTLFGKDNMTNSLQSSLWIYPDQPVTKGQSWKRKYEITTPFALETNSKFTLADIDQNTAIVDQITKVSTDPNQPAMEYNGMSVTMKMQGRGTGQMKINLDTGMVRHKTYRMNLSGTQEMNLSHSMAGNSNVPKNQKFDIQLELTGSDKLTVSNN